jgi:flavorubredoxin
MHAVDPPTGNLPRRIRDDLLWAGGAVGVQFRGQTVYGHFSCFVIKGSDKTLLVDSGHPMHWEQLSVEVPRFLDGRPIDYIFASHGEFP